MAMVYCGDELSHQDFPEYFWELSQKGTQKGTIVTLSRYKRREETPLLIESVSFPAVMAQDISKYISGWVN